MAADAASSRAGVVSPVAPVHSAQEPGAAMTPGVVNHVNPALQSGSQQQTPNEGEPGGRPKPRKSSAVSVVIEWFRINGTKVSVATIAFGNTCLNIITRSSAPSARAART